MYVGMIEMMCLKMLLKSLHENYSDLFIKITWYFFNVIMIVNVLHHWCAKRQSLLLGKYY